MARKIDQKLHQQRRKQILDAAAECFTEKGFHQTGMKEIYTKAGMSAGSVYHYFENKDAIIESIASDFSVDTRDFINTLDKHKHFIEGFIKATRKSLKETQQYRQYGRLVIEIYAESFRNEKVKHILQTLDDEAVEVLTTRIEAAIAKDQIASRHDPEMLAHLLIALVEGLDDRVFQNPTIKLTKLLKPFEELCRKL